MERRHVLTRLSVIGGISLSGCSTALDSRESGTVLGKIDVINFSSTPNRIHLTVERGDDTLVEREIGLTAIDSENSGAWTVIEPLWAEKQAQYTIRALHIDDDGNRETSSREYTFTREDYETSYGDSHEDPGCIGAVVKIGSLDEKENAPIAIGPTYMENPCGTPESR